MSLGFAKHLPLKGQNMLHSYAYESNCLRLPNLFWLADYEQDDYRLVWHDSTFSKALLWPPRSQASTRRENINNREAVTSQSSQPLLSSPRRFIFPQLASLALHLFSNRCSLHMLPSVRFYRLHNNAFSPLSNGTLHGQGFNSADFLILPNMASCCLR